MCFITILLLRPGYTRVTTVTCEVTCIVTYIPCVFGAHIVGNFSFLECSSALEVRLLTD